MYWLYECRAFEFFLGALFLLYIHLLYKGVLKDVDSIIAGYINTERLRCFLGEFFGNTILHNVNSLNIEMFN